MQKYHFGDVVLLEFPFVEKQESKKRPALVLLDTGDADILVARITSQNAHTEYDVIPVEWKQTGLLLPSVIRLHKMATLQKKLVKRRLGVLTPKDMSNVLMKLQWIWTSI